MLKICICKQCKHEWASKQEKPPRCPACRASGWDNDMMVIASGIHHVCGRCKWEWNGKENAIRCPRCQSLRWRDERKIYSHICQKCYKEWKSLVEKPLKCSGCQKPMEVKQKLEIYKYVNGGRVGMRCVCSAWYPLVEGRIRYRCPNCKSGAGGTIEIEKPEIGDEENWGPL